MKKFVPTTIAILVFAAAGALAADDGLAGVWQTAKGAQVTCDETTCKMTKQADDPTGNKPLGTIVLKQYAEKEDGTGMALHVHPIRDDAYLDVETQRDGDTLALTFRIQDLSSSSTWTRVKDGDAK